MYSTLYHAEPLPSLVDSPQQGVDELFVRVVVRQAELVEAGVGSGQRSKCGRRCDLETGVQLLEIQHLGVT